MGRPAKSELEHFVHGTVSKAQAAKASLYEGGRPKLPAHLSPAARSEMKRCIRLLEQRGTLTPGDFATLCVYAEVFARWVAAKREVGEQFMVVTTVTDNNGNAREVERLNPLLKVVETCESKLLSLSKSLGLTPVDREKVKPTAGNGRNEVIPGSMLDLHPEFYENKVTPIRESEEEKNER